MKKRIVQIEIIHDITGVSKNDLTPTEAAEYLVEELINSYTLNEENIYDYTVKVFDVEE